MKLKQNITYCISYDEVPDILNQLTTDDIYFVSPIESLRNRLPKIKLQDFLKNYLRAYDEYPGIYKDTVRFHLMGNYDDYQAIQLLMDAIDNTEDTNFLDELNRNRFIICE